MGTPQGMLDSIVESSLPISPCSIGGILKCVSNSLINVSPPDNQPSQIEPRSRAARPDIMFSMTERLLNEIVNGYDIYHGTGIHRLAFATRTDCYTAMRNLIGDEANLLKFRDTIARYQIVIGKYRMGKKCSPQEIGEVKDFCDRISGLAKSYTPPEYEH